MVRQFRLKMCIRCRTIRAIDRMYIHGSAPREAISKVDALIKTNLRTLNLIWDLPGPRTEEP